MITSDQLIQAMLELARKEFYYYCKFRLPQVFTDKRPHLKKLCNELQWFIEQDEKKNLIINLPPRHGKTLTVELLVEWVLGKSPTIGVMTACYNETLSSRFSKAVRGGIQEISVKREKPVFSDYFPGVKIKDGDGAMQLWALENSHFSFLATSPGGTMTGIGSQLLIIDDLIKNAVEAYNERILEDQWLWYTDTALSRLEAGAKQIVIQTRWVKGDLSGRLLDHEPTKWHLIKMPAQNPDGSMLCDDILDLETFEDRKTKTDPVIIAGNYQQEPYDNIDKLYGELKTWNILPDSGTREAYFDTADEGPDYLAGAAYIVNGNSAYVTDLIYTQDPMEITEGKSAVMLKENESSTAWIESNNGGRGFSRNVERIMRETLNYPKCEVKWFHQSENKTARILSNATTVKNSIFMPADWKTRWPVFYSHVTGAGRSAKLLHDDFADLLTGIVEKSLSSEIIKVYPVVISSTESASDKDTIYIGQDFSEGFVRPVALIFKNNAIHAVREFEVDQMFNAPNIVKTEYSKNKIVWFLDIASKEVFAEYRAAIQAQGIEIRVGTISPSPQERPVIINRFFGSGKLFISDRCPKLASALAGRVMDKSGRPETSDGPLSPHLLCSSLEYGVYRLSTQIT